MIYIIIKFNIYYVTALPQYQCTAANLLLRVAQDVLRHMKGDGWRASKWALEPHDYTCAS